MSLKQIALFLLLLPCSILWSQPAIEWQTEFGRSEYDRPYGVCSNEFGELVICGTTWNDSGRTVEGMVMKLDFTGNKIWQNVVGYGKSDRLKSIVSIPGKGYLAVGSTDSKGEGGKDIWVVKLDEEGKVEWEKTFGGKYDDQAEHVLLTKNEHYLICGSKMTVSSSTIEAWILLIKQNGDLIWEKQIGGHFREYALSASETAESFLIAGYMSPGSDSEYKEDMGFVASVNKSGELAWQKFYGGEKEDKLNSIISLPDGSAIACGKTQSFGKNGYADMWLLALDKSGKEMFSRTYGDIDGDEGASLTMGGHEILLAGTIDSRESDSKDPLVVAFNAKGEQLWAHRLESRLNEEVHNLIHTSDGGLVVIAERCTHYKYDSNPVKCKMLVYKFSGTPEQSVSNYVAIKLKAWEKRGEFEKTEDFSKRVNEANRNKIVEKHTREAIAWYAGRSFDWSNTQLSKYNADRESFSLIIGSDTFSVKVSLDKAQEFKQNYENVQFENAQYILKDGRFYPEKIVMVAGLEEYTLNTSASKGEFVKTGTRKMAADEVYRGSGDPLKGLNVSTSSAGFKPGKYFALIIGIDNYKGAWNPLNNAVRDAQAVELLLKNKYQIDHFKSLYDEQATRVNILNALEWLVEQVGENDNVLIYYSGHGEFKKELNKGFWVPADAQTVSVAAFISNADLLVFMNGIRSKHTLLVSDACFSGDIFRGNSAKIKMESPDKYYTETYSLRSRQAITSGGLEPVMDGGRDGHSVFAYYLLQALRNNNSKYLDASQLFEKIKIPVSNNSDQKPALQPIKNTGDEGGQFIFIKK